MFGTSYPTARNLALIQHELFPPEQRPYTARELQKCAEREVAIRLQVYPGKVARRRMSQASANQQVAMMRQIAEEYRLKAEQDHLAQERAQ